MGQIIHPRILIAVIVVSLCVSSDGEIPRLISYQGKVTDSGGIPVADGTYDMVFRLYDADTGGAGKWNSGITPLSVTVNGGVFSVILGESNPIGLGFDEDYWLEVEIEGDVQSPRVRIGSVGYAYMASGLVPGTEVWGDVATAPYAAIKGTNWVTSGTSSGIHGKSYSTEGRGVYGEAASSSGNTYGVYGSSASTMGGGGVYGQSLATAGTAYGVYGFNVSSVGGAVHGYNASTEPTGAGIYGYCTAESGCGVFGQVPGSGSTNFGVKGVSLSSGGRGVSGLANSTIGFAIGVEGQSAASGGYGVFGKASNTTGQNYGVYGESSSTSGTGVYGCATRSTGYTKGVCGYSSSTSGNGVHGMSSATTGIGVHGEASATLGSNYGVYGETASNTGIGVYGLASSTIATNYGVYGETNSTSGYAGYFDGNTRVTGDLTVDGNIVGVGDITAVYAGTGLEGGGTSGDVTFGVEVPLSLSASSTSAIIEGINTGTGTSPGVRGETSSTIGRAVRGYATSPTGLNYGVYASSESSQGTGIYGLASATTGYCIGVYGRSNSTTGVGVFGENNNGLAASFEGDARIEGDLTVTDGITGGSISAGSVETAGDYAYSSAKTFHLSMPACAFIHTSADIDNKLYWYDYDGLWITAGTSAPYAMELIAPLFLPEGSTISRITVYYYDNEASEDLDITVSLWRRAWGGSKMAEVVISSSGSSSSRQSEYDDSINYPSVDNENWQYTLNVDYSQNDYTGANLQFCGCQMEYTVSTIAP